MHPVTGFSAATQRDMPAAPALAGFSDAANHTDGVLVIDFQALNFSVYSMTVSKEQLSNFKVDASAPAKLVLTAKHTEIPS